MAERESENVSPARSRGSKLKSGYSAAKKKLAERNVTWLLFFNITFGIAAVFIFMILPFIFIFNQTNWKPRDWMIGFSIVFGIDWLYYLAIFIGVCTELNSDTKRAGALWKWYGDFSTVNTHRRFTAYFTIKTFFYITMMLMWFFWLAKYNYLNGASTPDAPYRGDQGFFSFQQLCIIHVFYSIISLVYNFILTRDINANRKLALTESELVKAKKKAPMDADAIAEYEQEGPMIILPRETSLMSTSGVIGYWASSFFLYLVAIVFLLMMFVQTFDVDTLVNLKVLFGLLVVMTVALIGAVASYYIGRVYEKIVAQRDGRLIDDVLFAGKLFWAFNIIVNWIAFAFYLAQNGTADQVDFSSYPHFDRNPPVDSFGHYVQIKPWYVWQAQAVFNGASVLFWLSYGVCVVFTTMRTAPIEAAMIEKRVQKDGLRATKPDTSAIAIVLIFWLLLLVIYTFTLSAEIGNVWFLTKYEGFIIAFTVIVTILIGAIIVGSRYRIGNLDSMRQYLNKDWVLSTWRVVVVLPLYFVMSMVTYWLSYGRYTTWLDGISESAAKIITSQPTAVPLNPFTYYWWNILTIQMLFLGALVIMIIDFSSTLTVKFVYQFTNKKFTDDERETLKKPSGKRNSSSSTRPAEDQPDLELEQDTGPSDDDEDDD